MRTARECGSINSVAGGDGAGADLRAVVFTRVQGFCAREVNGFGAPSLITCNTNDIEQFQLFLQMAPMLMVMARSCARAA